MKLTKLDSAVNSIAKYKFNNGAFDFEIIVPKQNYKHGELDMTNEQYDELNSLCDNFDKDKFDTLNNELKKIQGYKMVKLEEVKL